MKKFKPSFLTLSLMAAGLSLHAAPGFAQEDANDQAAQEGDVEVIQVKGFRSSLIKALNTKRFSDTVVDAISADDIGGLPDVSIADALARIPGVTSIRIDGQSSELNIRGLQGDFVFTTLNGREMVSSAGGRSVQFDQFPSELIQQAQIYKSQKASLIEGGVAGTVELQTVNALNLNEDSKFRLTIQGNNNSDASDNPDASDYGKRFTVSYQKKLLDDTVGIAVGYARLDQPTVSSRFVSFAGSPADTSGFEGLPDNLIVSNGFELNQRAGDDTRDSYVGSINWQPTDDMRLTWDGFYTEFDSVKFDRGILVGESNSGILGQLGTAAGGIPFPLALENPVVAQPGINPVLVGGTFIRDPNGTYPGPPAAPPFGQAGCDCLSPQIQNDNSSTFSETFATGLQFEWDINDQLNMVVDLSHSSAEENSLDEVLRLIAFEDSSAERPVVQDQITLNYQLNGLSVPDIAFNLDFTDRNSIMAASYERYPRIEENEANAARVDFTYSLDNEYVSSIEFGLRYSEREYELARGVFRIGGQNGLTETNTRSGQYIDYDLIDGVPAEVGATLPFQLNESNSSVVQFGGELSHIQPFLVVNDVAGLVSQWITDQDVTALPRWGIPNGVDEDGRTLYRDPTPWSVTDGSRVEEEVLSAYLQANLDMELGDIPVTGNVGMRVIDTDQSSLGLVQVGNGLGDVVADGFGNTRDDYQRQVQGDDYRHYLPSVNLNFQLNDTDQLRFAYAKVISRAALPDMRLSGAYTLGLGQTRVQNGQNITGNFVDLNAGGNPRLRPFEANQIDLSFERYFAESDGAFVVAVWNKDVNNFTTRLTQEFFDFEAAGIVLPEFRDEDGSVIQTVNGNLDRIVNVDDAGYIRGVELAYTQTFSFLPDLWKGLGVNLNFSYTESEINIDSEIAGTPEGTTTDLPGLSRRVWTATVFYEYDEIWEVRVNARYRSPYVSEQVAIGQAEQAFFEEETVVTAQALYNVDENLQIFASVDNLTDEPNISFFGDRAQTGTIQYFGRTIYLGLNYNL